MLPSVPALLSGIIDYAGLFPPAKLPLDEAIRNYARYRTEPECWMLGRFVIPAARLGELEPYAGLFSPEASWHLSVLGRGGNTAAAWVDGLRADLADTAAFHDHYQGRTLVSVVETRVSPELCRECEDFATLVAGAAELIAARSSPPPSPFYEIAVPGAGEMTVPVAANDVRLANQFIAAHAVPCPMMGLKFRCGGLEPSAFPLPRALAAALVACRTHGVAIKFTAGLHHPIRHFDRGVQAKMHGFLNVFGAGVLAHALRLSEERLREVLDDEDPSDFRFDEAGFAWKQHRVSTEAITAARREFVTSFGSCSFDEPRDDLRALGLLP